MGAFVCVHCGIDGFMLMLFPALSAVVEHLGGGGKAGPLFEGEAGGDTR